MKYNLKYTKPVYSDAYFFTANTMPRYVVKYKRTKFKKYFKKRRMRRMNIIAVAKRQIRWIHLFKYVIRCFRKRSNYDNNRRYTLYTNLQKIWWGVLLSIRFYSHLKIRRALFPSRKRFWFTANLRLNYPQFQVWYLHKKMYWQKLRKRWIWHRLIKRTIKVGFLSYLKKYFAYNIAIRKYFKKILPNYELHKKVMRQSAAPFLVAVGLAPFLKHAFKLCRLKRFLVNGKAVAPTHIMKPYDIVSFTFRKAMLWFRQKRFRHRRREQRLKMRKGLIYNRKMRLYIYYRNIDQLAGRPRISYLYYFYFYRNLLQTCRMR